LDIGGQGVSSETQVGNPHLAQFREGPQFLALSVIVPLTLIVIAEAFFFTRNMEAPLALHGMNILYCVLTPLLLNLRPQIFQAFSLVSILRMMNIGMPVFFDMTIYWLPFIYLPVIVVGIMLARSDFSGDGLNLTRTMALIKERLGRWNGHMIGLYVKEGLGLGALLGFIEYQILRPERLIPDLSMGSLLLLAVVMFLFVGLGEELLFRYLLQDRLKTATGMLAAILLSSFVFAIMHSGYGNAYYLVYVFFIGLIFGISYERTRSLLFVTVLHGAINFFLFSVFPY
jgi:hypothetical protein